jgi:hypothetical protein
MYIGNTWLLILLFMFPFLYHYYNTGTTEDFEFQLNGFDLTKFTVVAWDPPGYGKSRPPDRKQEAARAKKDAPFALQLMRVRN